MQDSFWVTWGITRVCKSIFRPIFTSKILNACSSGDSKFIPRIPEASFKAITDTSESSRYLYGLVGKRIYDTSNAGENHLGYPDKGHYSNYYPESPSITQAEIEEVGKSMAEKKLLVENTRLRKTHEGNFEIMIASECCSPPEQGSDIGVNEWSIASGPLAGKKISLSFGDHSLEMGKAADALESAAKYAANDNQAKMMAEYVKSFRTGSCEAFKQSQRYWIRDQGPKVESDLGFVETYRDPHGVRGEWEGFVAMVNQERTKAFGALVASAESMIPKLPWGKEFEKDKFLSPDFTSLEVLSFAGSGIPAGINIPNYDDIRQTEGFKNVSLGNVLSAKAPNEKIPFIADKDLDLYQKYRDAAFEVQVGIHELLGHGTGKLLQETSAGVYNFDPKDPPISPVDGKKVSTWYRPGQTWGSVFGSFASSYEECRAECVAMALSCDFSILKIFGLGSGKEDIDGEGGDVLFIAYLQMARAGVAALEFWDPKSRKWGQAHMQARYSILKCFLSAGPEFCKLDFKEGDLSNLTVFLDRSKILSHGRPAVEKYLQKLHVYKSTANFDAGKALYDDMTHVDEFYAEKVREVVISKKVPRKIIVQANTFLEADNVVLKDYPATLEGIIQSYAERSLELK
jgi:dipeptidyl-peptidase III